MGSFIGVFLGSGLYKYWHFLKYPDLYVVQAATWYTSIIVKVILKENMEWFKKLALILGIVFLTLTLIGGYYVLDNRGQVSAGYSAVPGLWTMICFGYYRSKT